MILLRPTPSWGCLWCPGSTEPPAWAARPARHGAHARTAGGPRSMVGATQKPPAEGLRTGIRENGTPWMYATKRRTARGGRRVTASVGIGSNLGGARGVGRRKRQFGPRNRPDRTRAGLVAFHLVAANGKPPITPSANRHPTIVARIKRATEHGECRGVASGSSWDSTTTAAPKKGSSLDPHLPHISGLQRLCSPRGPRTTGGACPC